ncbi:Uma2 family endonuclease [Halomicronema sp. CCY15110]|uniref:Uma2 family endonuclease n=1 Tax=Halomicronema sp. CCY15110 TaxID=2767773 RepID=UPI001EF1837E|nr:Uma2 family endonuclease [Halomicronema sp. CCY15110]
MAGASDVPVAIAVNLFALLRSHVRGTGCRVYIAAMKVRVEARNCLYYPDVVVTCDAETSTYKRLPQLMVAVLSDSTAAFDFPSETLRDRRPPKSRGVRGCD